MVIVMESYIRALWDDRHWSVALQAKDPMESYDHIKQEIRSRREGGSDGLEDLTPEQRDWYRSG